jgi:glutamate-1-semialdehyde 2,1-aminomutase
VGTQARGRVSAASSEAKPSGQARPETERRHRSAGPDVPRRNLTRSSELYRRAVELLPGGVNSPVRAMRQISRDPIFVARGEGATIVDVDGNEYVDWVSSWGPLILGHAHPAVVDAVVEAAVQGTTFGAPTEGEVKLAAEVVSRIPSVRMLRMTSSGTEATMSAIRLARAATGRERVLKFAGAYHGHVDGLLADAGSGLATQAIPASPGVPPAAAAGTVIVPWNDADAVAEATEGQELAAILAEPVPANMGVVPPEAGFLELLRERADRAGALLVFDEVITGFRVARGGAQERLGVMPDLTILGKVIGGGLPAAAYGGPAVLMERIAPAGDVYQAGTLSGNPLAVAAALATFELLDEAAYERLDRLTAALADGLRGAAAAAGVPVQVQSVTGLLTVFFSERKVRSYADAAACDLEAFAAWCRGLLARGVYPPASQFEAWFPSLAHSEAHVRHTVEAATAAFEEIR